MNFQCLIDSKFGALAAIAIPLSIPVVIFVCKIPRNEMAKALDCVTETMKAAFSFKK